MGTRMAPPYASLFTDKRKMYQHLIIPPPNLLLYLSAQSSGHLSEYRNVRQNKNPTNCMALLHLHSPHPLSCKEGIIYFTST